jgi:RNA polymerase sigma-70 factor (ECF subfamily)
VTTIVVLLFKSRAATPFKNIADANKGRMTSEAAIYLSDAISKVADEPQISDVAPECSPIKIVVDAALQIKSSDETDEELLAKVGTGSQEALSFLFRRHGGAVFNTAWRILRDPSEADDLRQDVFLYVFEKARSFDSGKGTAVSWIIQITYHRAIDRRRYLASRQHYTSREFNEEFLSSDRGQPSTDTMDGQSLL